MNEIHAHCSAGDITVYKILPAPPGWYARFMDKGGAFDEPIAAFGVIAGPEDLGVRLVGLLGSGDGIEPVDCSDGYLRTLYHTAPRGELSP